MDSSVAILMSLIAMLLWGSWANTILLAKTRFELFVLDFMIGHIISALFQVSSAAPTLAHAFTAGWYGVAAVAVCVFAGVLYAFAMLLSVAACNLAGMALSTVLVLGVEISIGTPLLMLVEGFGTAEHVVFSAAGIAAVLMAAFFDFWCHKRLLRDRITDTPYNLPQNLAQQVCEQPVPSSFGSQHIHERSSSLSFMSFNVVTTLSAHAEQPRFSASPQCRSLRRSNTFLTHSFQATSLTGSPTQQVASLNGDAAQRGASSSRCGMLLAGISGMCFSIWPVASSIVEGQSRAGNVVAAAELEPTSFFILYASSAFLACLILLPLVCRRPIHSGEPLLFWPSYLALPSKVHLCALCGGVMHGLGTVLSLESGHVLGNTVSVSILRCHPLVVSLWGVCVWAELSGAKLAARLSFACMLLMFVVAIAMFLCADLLNK